MAERRVVLSRKGEVPLPKPKLPTDLCKRCGVAGQPGHTREDHKPDTSKAHAHFRDSMQMKGMESRMFPTVNHDPTCHVTMCACMYFVEPDAAEVPPNMPMWYLRQRDAARLFAEAKAVE